MHILTQCLLLIAAILVGSESNSWGSWDSRGCVARCKKLEETRQCLGSDPSPCYGPIHRSSYANVCLSRSVPDYKYQQLQEELYGLVQHPLLTRVHEDGHLKLTVPEAVRTLLKKRGIKIENGYWMRNWQPLVDDGGDYRIQSTLHLPYIRSSDYGIYAFVIMIEKYQLVATLKSVMVMSSENIIDIAKNESTSALPCLLNPVNCFTYSILWYRDGILQSHLNNSRELRITEVGWTSAIWTCAVFAEELEGELSLTSYQVRTVSFIVFFRDLLLPQYQIGLIAFGGVVAVSLCTCALWPSGEDEEPMSDEMSSRIERQSGGSLVESRFDTWSFL